MVAFHCDRYGKVSYVIIFTTVDSNCIVFRSHFIICCQHFSVELVSAQTRKQHLMSICKVIWNWDDTAYDLGNGFLLNLNQDLNVLHHRIPKYTASHVKLQLRTKWYWPCLDHSQIKWFFFFLLDCRSHFFGFKCFARYVAVWSILTISILMSGWTVSKAIKMRGDEGLEQVLFRSRCHKGRLLYYFPTTER